MTSTWSIDSQTKKDIHTITESNTTRTFKFSFNVSRMKDACTNAEMVKVIAYLVENNTSTLLGTTYLEPGKLEIGLAEFKKFGVMLTRPQCIEIAKEIITNYYCFQPITSFDGNIIDEVTFQGILGIIINIIATEEIQPISLKPRHLSTPCEVYAISLKTFQNAIAESQYSNISSKAIQECLFQREYTLVNRGCFDYVAPSGEDKHKVKCICIYKDKLDKAVKELEEGEKA